MPKDKQKRISLTPRHCKFLSQLAIGVDVVEAFHETWPNVTKDTKKIKRYARILKKSPLSKQYLEAQKKSLNSKISDKIITQEIEKIQWTRDVATHTLLEVNASLMQDFRECEPGKYKIELARTITNVVGEVNKMYKFQSLDSSPMQVPGQVIFELGQGLTEQDAKVVQDIYNTQNIQDAQVD